MENEKLIEAIEMADKLVYDYYSTFEHMLNDEYAEFDWKVAAILATKQIDGILEFMKMDDEYSETCSNANSIWPKYWMDVVLCIKNKYIDETNR
jgi:hypothetical protein